MGPLLDLRLSFDAAVDAYDDVRPSYPAALFDHVFDLVPAAPHILEVGPGTGQATRDLIARGASVHAIELGPAMAARLRSNIDSDRLTVSVADFETADIPPGSVDALFAATAYHWISPAAQTSRPAAIIRPGGLIAIVDLVQVDSPTDLGFFAAAQPIYEHYGQGHSGPPAPTRDRADAPMRSALAADARFGDVSLRRFDWDQSYSAADYRTLMLSYSGTQAMDAGDRVGLLDDIEELAEQRFGGRVTRPLVATLTTAIRVCATP